MEKTPIRSWSHRQKNNVFVNLHKIRNVYYFIVHYLIDTYFKDTTQDVK